MIIVGSSAAKYHGLISGDPKDLDLWYCQDDPLFSYPLEADKSSVPNNIHNNIPTINGYATPDALYTIKCSHLGWDNPQWWKHLQDILIFKKRGCQLIPKLYTLLVEYWKVELNDKDFLSLDRTKEKFFTDHINYKYDHDNLHRLVAYPNGPVYTTCLKKGKEVLIDRDKFDKLPFEDKVKMFREEINVIAMERWYLNDYWFERDISWVKAYQLSLKKTITNLTKNWATDFIVQNLEYFIVPDFVPFKNVIQQLSLEEKYMSKIDLTPIEELKKVFGNPDVSLEDVVFELCKGYHDELSSNIPFGDFNDYEEYMDHIQNLLEEAGYKHLDQDGGGEGGSEYCYGVFSIGDVIYRFEYSYYSYNGYEYDYILDTGKIVTSKTKTITVYE